MVQGQACEGGRTTDAVRPLAYTQGRAHYVCGQTGARLRWGQRAIAFEEEYVDCRRRIPYRRGKSMGAGGHAGQGIGEQQAIAQQQAS